MESRESWERRWQLAKQRTDAKIIELHQISGNVQVKIIAFYVTLDYTIHHSL